MGSSFYNMKKGGRNKAPLPMVRLTTHLRISELVESIWGSTDHVNRNVGSCGKTLNLSEAGTRAKLIDPAIHRLGWTEDHIRSEETLRKQMTLVEKTRTAGKKNWTLLNMPSTLMRKAFAGKV